MRIAFRTSSPLVVVLSAAAFLMFPSRSHAQQAELTIAKSIEILNEMAINPKNGPPKSILLKAEGIAIIPDQVTAGFVLGASFGRGIVMVRKPDGSWSNPVFINAFGGSFGLQAGAQATDLVLVFKGRRSVESFLKGKGKLTLGIDASAAAGPVGRNFEAGTDLAFKAEILSYSRSRGIFAGVSAVGGTLGTDRKANTQYYTLPIGSGEILADNSSLKAPPSAAILKRVLTSQTGIPVGHKPSSSDSIVPDEDSPTVIIEGDDPEIEAPAPRTSSRRSSSSTTKASASRSAKTNRQRTVESKVDDDVLLAASPNDDDEDDSREATPIATKKTRSTSWKKSNATAASKTTTTRGTSSRKSDLEAEIEENSRSDSRSDDEQ